MKLHIAERSSTGHQCCSEEGNPETPPPIPPMSPDRSFLPPSDARHTVNSLPPPPASMIQAFCVSIADYVTTCFSLVPSLSVPSFKASGYVDPRVAQLD